MNMRRGPMMQASGSVATAAQSELLYLSLEHAECKRCSIPFLISFVSHSVTFELWMQPILLLLTNSNTCPFFRTQSFFLINTIKQEPYFLSLCIPHRDLANSRQSFIKLVLSIYYTRC